MRICLLFMVFSMFTFYSCNDDSDHIMDPNVIFLDPGPCCSNMELINGEPIYSLLAGYSETILAAINIDDFSNLGIEDKDSLYIEFEFSAEEFPCEIICNRQHGIPIKLTSVEKQ